MSYTWITPKTDWDISDKFTYSDYNRIRNNLLYINDKLNELFPDSATTLDLGNTKSGYANDYHPSEFNAFEEALKSFERIGETYNIGNRTYYRGNEPFIGYADLNRIESCCVRWYDYEPVRVTAELSPTSFTSVIDDVLHFVVNVNPSGVQYTTTWTTSDDSIMTIDSNGNATALEEGNVTITCVVSFVDLDPITLIAQGTVSEPAITSVSITPNRFEIQTNETKALALNVVPSNVTYITSWVSSNENVCTVNNNGVVTGTGVGQATITVVVVQGERTFRATSVATVVQEYIKATSITTNVDFVDVMYYNDKGSFDVTVLPDNATNKDKWTFKSNTISGTQVLASIKKKDSDTLQFYSWHEGIVQITVSVDDVSATVMVYSYNYASEVWFSQQNGSNAKMASWWVRLGQTNTLYVNTFPYDAEDANDFWVTSYDSGHHRELAEITKNGNKITIRGMIEGEGYLEVGTRYANCAIPFSVY